MIVESQRTDPVGVFDSGVGGLTVAREIISLLPKENIVYFGDTARLPYGSKSKETVIRFSEQIIRFLLTKHVKAIVIACNTASSLALDTVKKKFDIPLIGVVIPGARAAVREAKSGKIGVIGTEATVRSGIYKKVINGMDPKAKVIEKACPLFVPLVEEGFVSHPVTGEVIDYYLRSVKEERIDSMILGCTHYPLLKDLIAGYMGEDVKIVNPAYETALDLKRFLGKSHLLNNKPTKERGAYEFFVSDAAEKFINLACAVMPFDVEKANVIHIEEF